MKPRYICVSATNHYNLVAARKVITRIRAKAGKDVTIVVGGRALRRNPETAKEMGADLLLESFEDIRGLGGC